MILKSLIVRGGDGRGDTFRGQAGDDYLFGEGGADGYLYDTRHFDTDQIFGFDDGADKIVMSTSIFANFAAVQAATTIIGSDTKIDAGNGDVIVLKSFTALTADDFIFF